jgi:S1-C subfamily serine protease
LELPPLSREERNMKPQPEVYQVFHTRNFLPVFLALCVFASVSCGGGTDSGAPSTPATNRCDLASQEDEQRAYERDEYFPKIYSHDFFRDLGADISPTDDDYDLAREVSRSVFELEFRRRNSGLTRGGATGWLIAPRYVATAAHNVARPQADNSEMCEKRDHTIHVHTFDGDTIDAEVIWFDKTCEYGTDLALLRLEREINAFPMKIADERPGRNEMLMAMGYASSARGLGAWTVTAGPALEPRSGQTVPGWLPRRVYHWVPTSGGMSGGPIFNRRGEVVSIVSTRTGNPDDLFGVRSFQKPAFPPENLWVYGFVQIPSSDFHLGPNPGELRELYNKDPGLSEPANAGDYRNSNEWKKADHRLGDHYSPFPIDQFDRMNRVYKEAREGAVTVKVGRSNGSGFIYDDSTVITAGHVAVGLGREARIKTIDGQYHPATVSKIQQENNGCDIAVLRTVTPGALRGYKKLDIGDSSSLRCGDPLVQIGSGFLYNAVGELQGLGAVYMTTGQYSSNFRSRSGSDGMSGGPVVDRDGDVVSITAFAYGEPSDEWDKPGPLYIHTRLPVYEKQDGVRGLNSEAMKKFIEQNDFYCPQ